MKFKIFVTLFFLLITETSFAEKYTLFEKGEQGRMVRDYDDILAKLKPDDVIVFSDGKEFTVKKILGSGNTTLVLDIGNGKVLRIPKATYLEIGRVPQSFIDYFLEAYQVIKKTPLPVVEVFVEESLMSERVVAENLNIILVLGDTNLSPSKILKKIASYGNLMSFVRKLGYFEFIGDLHPRQIALTDKGYRLFDFTDAKLFTSESWNSLDRFEIVEFTRQLPISIRHQALAEVFSGWKNQVPISNVKACSEFAKSTVSMYGRNWTDVNSPLNRLNYWLDGKIHDFRYR